jgi:hypothetical protein
MCNLARRLILLNHLGLLGWRESIDTLQDILEDKYV